jgi:hypothetical protein
MGHPVFTLAESDSKLRQQRDCYRIAGRRAYLRETEEEKVALRVRRMLNRGALRKKWEK